MTDADRRSDDGPRDPTSVDESVRLRLPSVPEAQTRLRQDGFVVINEFLREDHCAALAALALSVVDRFGVQVTRSSGQDMLDYRVVTGDVVQSEAPPLFELYTSRHMITWMRAVTMIDDLATSPYLRSSININCLTQVGQRYPWHTDAVPFTALLFLTTLGPSVGGELLIRTTRRRVVTVAPVRGKLLLMDGKRCAHAVAPLRQDVYRTSVPMVYPANRTERPPGLDQYLYQTPPKAV
jgi:hypothetical protein